MLARNPQLHEQGEETVALAELAFAAASAALACDPACADFAGCAREAVAVALGELLARATTGGATPAPLAIRRARCSAASSTSAPPRARRSRIVSSSRRCAGAQPSPIS